MNDTRPNPDALLARVKTEEFGSPRGRLRIFFGYAAGVGKTYTMLETAHAAKKDGVDVVVGYVEPHGRKETEALLEGLEQIPPLKVPYRGTLLNEFDVDATLARKPQLALVDELAHSNADGMRHVKRWQDVDELLAAGIDVYTTVNVQHVESLNDVIAQITGMVVRETIPDAVIERADDIELVDITPEQLLQRLAEGKVYVPQQAQRAIENFFQRPNLVALRELSLRKTAERIHADVQNARQGRAATLPWATSETLLVCIGPSPSSAAVIRSAKRLADLLQAKWLAVHVETAGDGQLAQNDRERLIGNLQLAERLGAEPVTLSGADVVSELIEFARARNVTKIVLGKTDQPRRRFLRRESLVDRLMRNSGNVDVYVVRGGDEHAKVVRNPIPHRTNALRWLGTAAILACATAVSIAFDALGITEANIIMMYLLGVVIVASLYGVRESIVASVLAVLLFDVLFIAPVYSISVHDTQYLITLTVMLIIALFASSLTTWARRQAEVSRRNERRLESLYRLSRTLSKLSGLKHVIEESERVVSDVFDSHTMILIADREGKIRPLPDHLASFAASAVEFGAAQWVLDRERPAGLGTDTLPSLQAIFLPLVTPNGIVGVMGTQPSDPKQFSFPEARHLLETYASQIALAIERERLAETTRQTLLQVETEKLRSVLLSSISHDLRTPLAAIAGASSSLVEGRGGLSPEIQHELIVSIYDESHRLTRLVENILNMTRLTSGAVTIAKEWHPVGDVVGSALHRMERQLGQRDVSTEIADDLPLGHFDAVLVEQVLMNLLDNAVKYSAPDAPIDIHVSIDKREHVFEICDRGRGLDPGDETQVFEMFYRHRSASTDSRGTGLGLAICKSIIEAHGGTISAANRHGGGAVFKFTIPFDGTPPRVPLEVDAQSEAT